MPPPHRPEFIEFVADIEPSLRRALAEEFGPAAGREATVDALAFAWANWDRVAASDDATAYLLKVGQTAAERHQPLATGDVTPILPRSQAAFDALVPPIGAAAAMDRATELVSGAPTTMLARPEAPTTVVATTPVASAYTDGPATMRLPVPPSPTPGPPMRRTVPWVVAAVLVGVIALGGIALANRSDDGPGGTDTSLLPTLPTAATVSTVASSAPASPPSADTSVPVNDTVVDTLPPDDGDDDDTVTTQARPPSSAATTPPATDPPETNPPDTDPPDTEPPPSSAATTPPSTPPPSSAPPETTLPPRPTVPDDVTDWGVGVSPRRPEGAARSRR